MPEMPLRRPAPAGSPIPEEELAELERLGQETAADVRLYIETVTQVATGAAPDSAMSLLLLATAQILVAGSRLGAIGDIVPIDRYEADIDEELDVDPLRTSLANLFEGIDEYADVIDPLTGAELTSNTLSGDLTDIALSLSHGLAHHRSGRFVEALWWWQFSYLSTWGDRAASAVRVLTNVLSHIRLDADEEVVSEAEFDALHP